MKKEKTPQEIEMKFIAPNDALFKKIESLEEIEGFKVLNKDVLDMENRYMDTKNQDLRKNKAMLRIRKKNDKFFVFFKKEIVQDKNLFVRDEIWKEVPAKDLNRIMKLNIEPIKRTKEIIGDQPIQENIYRNENKRTILNLAKKEKGPVEIEMALDRVIFFKNDKKSMPFYEIEIESKGISEQELRKFAALLGSKYDLKPSTIGKSARGEQAFKIKPEKYNLEKGIEKIKEKIEELKEKINRPIIIAIAGGSGSGKTSKVAEKINKLFSDSQIFRLDDYYKGKKFMEGIGSDNWDELQALDLDLFKKHLQQLKKNKTIHKPIYSVKQGERIGYEDFSSSRIIITEGLFTLNEKIVNEVDLPIFIELGVHGRLLRRLMRDIKRTSQTQEEILRMYAEAVHPMHELYVEPTKKRALLIIVNEYDPLKEADRSEKYEIQIKLPVDNLDKIRKKLKDLKIEKSETKWQQDIYFEAPNWSLPKANEIMRIRHEEGKYILTYKGPSKGKEIRTKSKIEFQINPDLKDVLEKIGYKKILQINKKREEYLFDGIEIALDEVESLGEFVELGTENPKHEKKINKLIRKLELDLKSATQKSYFELAFKNGV